MSAKRILWRGKAQIEKRSDVSPDADLALVNQFTVTGAATADDVYVSTAMVCNDQVDYYSTQFTQNALRQVAALLPGVNLMRNHQEYESEDLPIGRIYAAEVLTVDGVTFVRARFYWEKGTEHGDAMARRIMLGIWREVSLSWWMESFTNSVDGKPFDESPYYAGQELGDGTTVVGIMDGVVEVNEVSIVSRGGQKDTSIGDVRSLIAEARSRSPQDWFARYGDGSRSRVTASPFEGLGITS